MNATKRPSPLIDAYSAPEPGIAPEIRSTISVVPAVAAVTAGKTETVTASEAEAPASSVTTTVAV